MVKNAKDYLKGYKRANAKLWRLMDDYHQTELKIVGGGINYDGMPHGSMPTSKVENTAVKLSDLKKDIAEMEIEAESLKNEIKKTIELLEDDDQKMILSALYIKENENDPRSHYKPTRWEDVARMTYIGERQGQRIHEKALLEIERILRERNGKKICMS